MEKRILLDHTEGGLCRHFKRNSALQLQESPVPTNSSSSHLPIVSSQFLPLSPHHPVLPLGSFHLPSPPGSFPLFLSSQPFQASHSPWVSCSLDPQPCFLLCSCSAATHARSRVILDCRASGGFSLWKQSWMVAGTQADGQQVAVFGSERDHILSFQPGCLQASVRSHRGSAPPEGALGGVGAAGHTDP